MNKYTKYLGEVLAAIPRGDIGLPKRHCVSCGRTTRFLISGAESRSIRCLSCRSTAISLATMSEIRRLEMDPTSASVYELSYHGAVFRYLQSRFARFTFSEYFGPPAGGQLVNGIRNEDVQNLSFPDAKFDLVSSTEVFEHVPDYMRGFSEVARVLKPGGWFVFTVPFFDNDITRQICRLTPSGVEWIGTPEYHDSQVTGVATVPVFWHHSKRQLINDLQSVGFREAQLTETRVFTERVPQHVVVARR